MAAVEGEPIDEGGVEARVDELLGQMSLAEKIEQMHGTALAAVDGFYETPSVPRLGIPGFRMADGPRGLVAGVATTFPVAMARGATWDPDLERRIGEAIGAETAAKGGNVTLAPAINILRHPGWGRAQETYGEDVHHLARMGVAFIEGAQKHVVASVKHLAVNSIEDTRFDVNVTVDERTLREIYLPHFEAAVKQARVGSVMSAYNKVNGLYCAENPTLLRDILKDEWGFTGFVESDWILGTRSTAASALAGLDIEMPQAQYFGPELARAVERGDVGEDVIDEHVRRVLRIKLRFGLDEPRAPADDIVGSAEHRALALEAARKAIVLLKNDGTLPLDPGALSKVVLVGELADTPSTGDVGSSNTTPPYVVTPLGGVERRAGSFSVEHVGEPMTDRDEAIVAAADAAIVVVGLTSRDEGEQIPGRDGGDRDRLGLSPEHVDLVNRVAARNPRTVVVVQGGSAVTMSDFAGRASAVLMAWYLGQEGGSALADVLFGDTSPSGKLPLSIPCDEADLPEFDHTSHEVTYGYFHGYRHLDREGRAAQFPFGFGLSYTKFSYDALRLSSESISADGSVTVAVDVTNRGDRAGDEIVQAYVGARGSRVERSVRELKGFARVTLEPGETKTVELTLRARDLAYYDVAERRWRVEPITYLVSVGPSSTDLPLSESFEIR